MDLNEALSQSLCDVCTLPSVSSDLASWMDWSDERRRRVCLEPCLRWSDLGSERERSPDRHEPLRLSPRLCLCCCHCQCARVQARPDFPSPPYVPQPQPRVNVGVVQSSPVLLRPLHPPRVTARPASRLSRILPRPTSCRRPAVRWNSGPLVLPPRPCPPIIWTTPLSCTLYT